MLSPPGGDVGRGREPGRRCRVTGAHGVVVEVHRGGDGEGRLQVHQQALPRHQRLDLRSQTREVLLGGGPEDVAVLLVGEAEDEEGVELAQQLVVEQLGLLGDGAEPDLELASLPGQSGKDVGLAVLGRAEDPLRLLEHDGHHREPLVALRVVEVGGRPLVHHPAGEEGGDEDLLGGAQTAHVHQHHPAVAQVPQHGGADRDGWIGRHARQLDDASGPAVHDLEGVEGDPAVELDVPEAGQVVQLGELQQPRQPVRPVEALQLEERLLLAPGPVVGGAQVVDGQLGEAHPQARRARQRPGRVGAQRLGRPGMTAQCGPVLPVGIDEQQSVAALATHDRAREHLHEVRLPHARRGEDAHVAGEARTWDAHLHVHLGLAAAQPADGQVPHAAAQEGEVGRLGRDHAAELCRQALRLAEGPPVGAHVAQAPALGHAVGAPAAVVERMRVGRGDHVVGQESAGHPFGPTGLAVLGPVGDVDDPEQVAPPGRLVDAHQQLSEEQVLVGRGAEDPLQHVAAEQAAFRSGDLGHARSMSR